MKYEVHALPNDRKSLLKLVEGQGWQVEDTAKGHLKITNPEGKFVYASGTPSDHRAIKKLRSDLKRLGLRPYSPLKEDKKVLDEPKTVISRVHGDSTTPISATVPMAVAAAVKRKTSRGALGSALIDIVRELDKPEGVTADEVTPRLQQVLPHLTKHNVGVALSNYVKKKKLLKVSSGHYRVAAKLEAPAAAEDDDVKVLEDLLTALAKAEQVIKRTIEMRRQFADIAQKLGAIKR